MLRQRLSDELKAALKSRDTLAVSALRLILAALKDRDIAARGKGNNEGIDEAEIIDMMQKMVKQRQESIVLYEKGNRADLVAQEQGEIGVIERFMPKKLNQEEMDKAIVDAFSITGAQSLKDMGKVMNHLKEHFSGRMDFAHVGQIIKDKLSA